MRSLELLFGPKVENTYLIVSCGDLHLATFKVLLNLNSISHPCIPDLIAGLPSFHSLDHPVDVSLQLLGLEEPIHQLAILQITLE